MRCPAMSVQFAVLASGSRGNSTLVRGRGAGLLIDVGIGPRAIGERLESVGATWSRIAAVVLTHTHADHVDTAAFAELARRGVMLHCHEGHRAVLAADPGFRKLEEARLIRLYDDRPFLTSTGLRLEPIELRHDGGPTFGFRIEASAGRRQRPVEHRLPRRHGELVRDHGREPGRRRRARRRIQSRRGPAEVIPASRVPDRAKPERRWAPVEPAGGRAGPGRARPIARRRIAPRGLAPPERTVQSARSGDPGRGRRDRCRGALVQVHAARQSPAFPNLWVRPRASRPRAATFAGNPASKARASQNDLADRAVPLSLTGLLFGDSDQE